MNSLTGGAVVGGLHLYQWPGTAARSYATWMESPMGHVRVAKSLVRFLPVAAMLMFLVPASHAQKVDVSGRYQCAQAKVRGKIIPCKAAPLILKNDGHFELRGWEGSYLVNGEWVELSDSLVKARAKIEPGHKIVLRYYGKHGLVEMTYERRVAELGKTSLS
jgi:hypothetical protein